MTNFELLVAQLAESILMDWDKEKQVELAKKVAVEIMHISESSNETPIRIEPIPDTVKEPSVEPPIVVMYGVQVQPWRPIDSTYKTSDSITNK